MKISDTQMTANCFTHPTVSHIRLSSSLIFRLKHRKQIKAQKQCPEKKRDFRSENDRHRNVRVAGKHLTERKNQFELNGI